MSSLIPSTEVCCYCNQSFRHNKDQLLVDSSLQLAVHPDCLQKLVSTQPSSAYAEALGYLLEDSDESESYD